MNQNVNLDLIPKFAVYGNLYFSQYDVGREAVINLLNGAEAYNIPSGATVKIQATKPSGLGFSQVCNFTDNVVTVVCTEEMTDESGRFPCELSVSYNGTVLGTANFTFNVEKSPHPEGTTDGTAESVVSEITLALQSALSDISDEATTQIGLVTAEGTTQVGNVNTAGTTQVNAVNVKGQEVIASIPSDYTSLANAVEQISSYTKNMFDPSYLISVAGWTEQDGVYSGTATKLHQNFYANSKVYPISGFKENTRYTLSLKAYTDQNEGSTGQGIMVRFNYSDGTSSAFGMPNSTSEETNFVGISTGNKTVTSIGITYGGSGGNIWHLSDIQCEEGVTQTEYVSYLIAYDQVARQTANDSLMPDAINLFSIQDAVKNYYISSDGSLIYNDSAVHVMTSDFIPIDNTKKYTVLGGATPTTANIIWFAIAFYNSSKALVGSRTEIEVSTETGTFASARRSITPPSNAVYARVCGRFYNDGYLGLYEGTKQYPYLPSAMDSYKVRTDIDEHDTDIALSLGNNIKSVNHAGWYEAPENTLPAYKASKQHGFYYVETDVSFTSDNIPVLLHDNTINRTGRNADGTEISETINIYDITFEQAQAYDFGIYKSSEYAGTKLPSLEQFILLCRNLGLHPYIELKSSYNYTQAQIESCVDIVKRYGMKDKVTWASFSNTYLGYVKNYDDSARLGYIVSSVTADSITNALALKTANNEVFIHSVSYTN